VRPAVGALQAKAAAALGEGVRFDEPMSRHTMYGIGGPADAFVQATSVEQLEQAMAFASEADIAAVVIGAGSNLLVPDEGLRALVIKVDVRTVRVEGTALTAGAGLPVGQAAETARAHALAGLEFCAGIPGSVGGALAMNAGCFGTEIGSLVEQVEVVGPDGARRTLGRDECEFAYRSSSLRARGGAIAGATLRLAPGDPAEIGRRMAEHRAWRANAHPLDHPSAGSVFKNPPGDKAGRLIEAAGCKGLQVGGAQVSPKHANFIVNLGGATYADVKALIETVRGRVEAQFGVPLELELIDLGGCGQGAAR
jgi:UDP-N-acetylmuramate dehydrogenase